MKSQHQILNLLSSLDSQQSINKLVEVCYTLALSYLRFSHKRIHKIILREDISLEDLAIDSIASLFSLEKNKNEMSILTSFKNWKPPIKTEEEAQFFINKLIQKRVEQHISSILRESDPFFAKIMDSVNYLIRKHNFGKTSYLGAVYVVKSDHEEISGKIISIDEFEKLSAVLFSDKKNLLQKLFEYLSAETKFFPAIPFNALIYKLKKLSSGLFKISEETTVQNEELEIESIIKEALDKTFEKIEDSYLSKEKFSREESEIIKKSLRDLANDLRDGGINPGLYKYLLANFPSLDEECYKQKYHNILEYLLKVLKQNIADQLVH